MTIQNIVSITSFVLFAVSEYRSYKKEGPKGFIQLITSSLINTYEWCKKHKDETENIESPPLESKNNIVLYADVRDIV